MNIFVIDTNILVFAGRTDDRRSGSALDLILIISQKHTIALDSYFGEIFHEYSRNLNDSGVVFKLIVKMMTRGERVVFGRTVLPSATLRKLQMPPGFDKDDLKFAEVAFATVASIITEDTEPGDFDGRVSQILQEDLNIKVHTINTALQFV